MRVRQAAGLAIDCQGTNEALTLGYSDVNGNAIVPKGFDFYWQPPAPVYDPAKAKQLLAAAGFAKGFDAGNYFCDASYANIGEAVVNNLLAVGIRSTLRPVERAAFIKEYSEKKYKNIIQAGPGAFGNAATRAEAHLVKGGVFSYGSYPDIDALYQQQADELDRARREAILFKIQQLMVERAIYVPIWQLAFINGVGPRVGEFGVCPHPAVSLHRAVRGHHAQGRVTAPGRAIDPQSYRMWQNFRHPDRSRAQRGAVEGPVLLPRRQDEVPRLRRPLGGFARDDGINSHMR